METKTRRIAFLLSPEAAHSLDALIVRGYAEEEGEAITQALIDAANSKKRKHRGSMTQDELHALADHAIQLHSSLPATAKECISVDTVFSAVASTVLARAGGGSGTDQYRRLCDEPAPAWFLEQVEDLRGTGMRITCSGLLQRAGRSYDRAELMNIGRWLREQGITPRKSGGQILFEL